MSGPNGTPPHGPNGTPSHGGGSKPEVAVPSPYGSTRCALTYWDARYAQAGDEPFDWYMGYAALRELMFQVLPEAHTDPELLYVGCGTSELPAKLYEDGWRNVVGVDTSVVAVTRARGAGHHAGRHELQFLQMDACGGLEFPDGCFHVVIDKALLDTLATGGHAYVRIRALLAEVHRVLKPGGVYILISHGSAAVRLPWLLLEPTWGWRIEAARLPRPAPAVLTASLAAEGDDEDVFAGCAAGGAFFYFYVCTKPGGDAEGSCYGRSKGSAKQAPESRFGGKVPTSVGTDQASAPEMTSRRRSEAAEHANAEGREASSPASDQRAAATSAAQEELATDRTQSTEAY